MADVLVRSFREGDGLGVARSGIENGAYYARIAPDHFKEPDVEGLAAYLEGDVEALPHLGIAHTIERPARLAVASGLLLPALDPVNGANDAVEDRERPAGIVAP